MQMRPEVYSAQNVDWANTQAQQEVLHVVGVPLENTKMKLAVSSAWIVHLATMHKQLEVWVAHHAHQVNTQGHPEVIFAPIALLGNIRMRREVPNAQTEREPSIQNLARLLVWHVRRVWLWLTKQNVVSYYCLAILCEQKSKRALYSRKTAWICWNFGPAGWTFFRALVGVNTKNGVHPDLFKKDHLP